MVRVFFPRRALGRTGFQVTRIGIGDIADRRLDAATLVATLHRAMDAGLNLIDTAPGYEDGYSEQIVGQALRGRREAVFVIDKIDFFDQPVATQVDASLKNLQLDHVDLMALHGLSSLPAWNAAAAPGGLMDQLDEARNAGKVRFCGISSHDPDTLIAALHSGRCDVVMFPIGPYVHERYVTEVLPLSKRLNVGSVCFKTFGAGKLLGDTAGYNQPLADRPRGKVSSGGTATAEPTLPRLSVQECLDYTCTLDPDVALLGMSFPNEQDAAFAAARRFSPMTEPQLIETRRRATEAIKEKGKVWWNPGNC